VDILGWFLALIGGNLIGDAITQSHTDRGNLIPHEDQFGNVVLFSKGGDT
jgi:hypothetical protein